jgi:hypothetical protein
MARSFRLRASFSESLFPIVTEFSRRQTNPIAVRISAEERFMTNLPGPASVVLGLRAEGTNTTDHEKALRRNLSLPRGFALTTLILILCTQAFSETKNSAATTASVQSFLGRWDLTLKTPLRDYPSWLEITQDDGKIKARMVSRWGHARPLPECDIANGRITFVSPKEEEDRKDDMVFEGKLSGKTLAGTTTGPDGTPWRWTGERAPSLKKWIAPTWGKPLQLFNGRDLSGWKMRDADMESRGRNAGKSRARS